jgi:hypothetical protein
MSATGIRSRFATALVLGALALLLPSAATEAEAQAPYQAYLAANCADGGNFCTFESEVVPASRRLDILRVACQGWHISSSLPSFIVIADLRTADNAIVRRIDFLKTTYAPANGGSTWAIGEETLMFVPAGHKVQINLNSGTTGVGSNGCTISGYLATVK